MNPNRKRLYKNIILIAVLLISAFIFGDYPNKDQEQTILDETNKVLGQITQPKIPDDYFFVKDIVDGDTIKINYFGETLTVRLVGIDTPETKHPKTGQECFGNEAALELTRLLSDSFVRIQTDSVQNDYDRYGRLLAHVFLPDGTFVNQHLVSNGFATVYTQADSDYMDQLINLELQAKNNNLGLWHSCPINQQ